MDIWFLCPFSLQKNKWSKEDQDLIQVDAEIGNKWEEIAKISLIRTKYLINNYWNSTKRRLLHFFFREIRKKLNSKQKESNKQIH